MEVALKVVAYTHKLKPKQTQVNSSKSSYISENKI